MSPSDPPSPADLVVTTIIGADDAAAMTGTRRQAADLLARSVGPDLSDDRFEPADEWADDEVLALARLEGEPVAYVTAASSRGRLQFDAVADLAALQVGRPAPPNGLAHAAANVVSAMVDQTSELYRDRFVQRDQTALVSEVWGRPRQPWHDTLGARLGLTPHRTLYQMRCRLPVASEIAEPLATRALDAGGDAAEMVAVNNRAFSYHPDQSNQDLDHVLTEFDSEDFEPESIRIIDAAKLGAGTAKVEIVDDRPMAGFCWTKIHEAVPGRPALGEIYVIAVDPAYHGHGLGLGLTAAGLDWMAQQGLQVGMLFVESDNGPAVRTYHKLGFEIHAEYTAWRAGHDGRTVEVSGA